MVGIESRRKRRISFVMQALLVCASATRLLGATADAPNAALLYYQAMILSPDLDRFPAEVVRAVARGTASARDVKLYVDRYDEVLETVIAGAQIPPCDWGLSTQGPSFEVEAVKHSRAIQFLFGASARVLAENGDGTAAFEQLTRLRQFAAHVAGEPGLGGTLPSQIEQGALVFWRYTMGAVPLNEESLACQQKALAFDPFPAEWLPTLLRFQFERTLLAWRGSDLHLSRFRSMACTHRTPAYQERHRTYAKMDDEELLGRIAVPYQTFLDDVLGVLVSDRPYGERYEQIDSRVAALKRAALDEPTIIMNWLLAAQDVPGQYASLSYHRTQLDALRAAVEIYRARAQTGQLPPMLPNDLPKDPFSNEDFEYGVTSDGFILRCAAEMSYPAGPVQFEFRVKAPTPEKEEVPVP